MRNVIGSKEAGIVPLAVIVVAMIIVAGVIFAFSTGVSTEYWEDEAEFGMWQEEIIIEFSDGSTESLKIIQENEAIASVIYNLKAVSKVKWLIAGVATGEGYNKAVVDRSGVKTHWYINKGSTRIEDGFFTMSGTTDLWIDGNPGTINVGEIDVVTKMDNDPTKYPDGTYSISFVPQGTVKYMGMPGGTEWQTATLPPLRAIGLRVERATPGSILVTLSSDVIFYYL